MNHDGDRYLPISDYAIIGCTRSAALISRQGSIDWLCWPRFDSRSIFARILDSERGGSFSIKPSGTFTTERRYIDATNVLETTFRTDGGSARLLDLMPVMLEEEKKRSLLPFRQLLRRIEVTEGEILFEIRFQPRPDYGRKRIDLGRRNGQIVCEDGPMILHLRSDVRLDLDGPDAMSQVTLRRGEKRYFALAFDDHAPAIMPHIGDEADQEIERTVAYWRGWASALRYDGPYRPHVLRSALVLKLLTYAPSGAIVAAPTTSLPEKVGGIRNWDYRYCWLRDASFTVSALDDFGFETEGGAFVDWLLYATGLTQPRLQILYDVFGEKRIPESELDHLEGYRQSRPVRVGNEAHGQVQLDIYGEVLGAVQEHLGRNGGLDRGQHLYRDVQKLLRTLADMVVKHWREPDNGIWEKRGGLHQHVHAKVMSWSALDTALRFAEKGLIKGDTSQWKKAKEEIRALVLERGFNRELNSFVGILDGNEVDASLLYIARVGFLEPADPRILGTIDAIRRTLGRDELLYRYEITTDDGLPPGEGAFLPCSFWLVESLALAGREEEATEVLEKLLARANDVLLFSEEIDVESGALIGNFPQAITHISLMNAALCLHQGAGRAQRRRPLSAGCRTLRESRRRLRARRP